MKEEKSKKSTKTSSVVMLIILIACLIGWWLFIASEYDDYAAGKLSGLGLFGYGVLYLWIASIVFGVLSMPLLKKLAPDPTVTKSELETKIDQAIKEFTSPGVDATAIGGSGYPEIINSYIIIGIKECSLIIISKSNAEIKLIPYKEILELEISGPGQVKSDAGVIGGGFGLEGFLKGAAAAAIINAATAKVETHTFMRLMTKTGELFLHTSATGPDHLRMMFSSVFVYMKNQSTSQQNHLDEHNNN